MLESAAIEPGSIWSHKTMGYRSIVLSEDGARVHYKRVGGSISGPKPKFKLSYAEFLKAYTLVRRAQKVR